MAAGKLKLCVWLTFYISVGQRRSVTFLRAPALLPRGEERGGR